MTEMTKWMSLFSNDKRVLTESGDSSVGSGRFITIRITSPEELADEIVDHFEGIDVDSVVNYEYPLVKMDGNIVTLLDIQQVFKEFENNFQGFIIHSVE